MNYFKRKFLGLIIRILDSSLLVDYTKIDIKAFENWAWGSFSDTGWRSYFAQEDLKILKSLGIPKPDYEYWILIGRRLQLLYLADEMRKAVELKKSAEEKRKSEAETEKKT